MGENRHGCREILLLGTAEPGAPEGDSLNDGDDRVVEFPFGRWLKLVGHRDRALGPRSQRLLRRGARDIARKECNTYLQRRSRHDGGCDARGRGR